MVVFDSKGAIYYSKFLEKFLDDCIDDIKWKVL